MLALLDMKKVSLRLVYWILAAQTALLVVVLLNRPPAVHAQSAPTTCNLFIEPGTQMLVDPSGRQSVLGKVAIDLTTGNVWGFPTFTSASYPSPSGNLGSRSIPVSKPFLLAKFDLASITR
jgi:hypothetical protein